MPIKFASLPNLVISLISLISLCAVQTASAADLPERVPVYVARPAIPVNSWTGCYVGGNAGRVRGANSTNTFPSGTWFTGATAADQIGASSSFEPNGSGISGGGEIGCNYQIENWVLGGEADFQGTGLKESSSILAPTAGAFLPSIHTDTTALNWFSTARGRVGWAIVDPLLIYGTGGLAFGKVASTFDRLNLNGINHYVGSASETRVGWTVGGGIEYALSRSWSVKAEYLFLNFGSFSYAANQIIPTGVTPDHTWTVNVDAREHVLRIGLNYRFQ